MIQTSTYISVECISERENLFHLIGSLTIGFAVGRVCGEWSKWTDLLRKKGQHVVGLREKDMTRLPTYNL